MDLAPQPRRQGTIVRAVVWIVISSVFLVWNARRLLAFRSAGLVAPWFLYVQIVVWLIALGFWLWTGWRELRLRDTPRKVL